MRKNLKNKKMFILIQLGINILVGKICSMIIIKNYFYNKVDINLILDNLHPHLVYQN